MAQESQIQEAESQQSLRSQQASISPQKESDFAVSIKALQEESLQISELSETEKTYAVEVISALKQIIEPLNVSYHAKPAAISKADSSLTDVVLTPQGVVCLIHNNGIINSKPLEGLQSETLVRLLAEIIPEVKALLIERRQKISGRVGMLEKVAREFRKVASTLPGRPRVASAEQQSSGYAQVASRERSSASHSGDALKASLSGQ